MIKVSVNGLLLPYIDSKLLYYTSILPTIMKTFLIVNVLLLYTAVESLGVPRNNDDALETLRYPYLVSLKNRYNQHACTGVIIDDHWILTSVVCTLLSSNNDRLLKAYAGITKVDEEGQVYNIREIIWHDDYSSHPRIRNNLALIRVFEKIEFNEKVQPISLPSLDMPDVDIPVAITGWIYSFKQGRIFAELQQKLLKIIDIDECNQSWEGKITNSEICTVPKEAGEKSCGADYGTPLVANNILVGIVSDTSFCSKGVPNIFTKVYSYLEWIKNELKKSD